MNEVVEPTGAGGASAALPTEERLDARQTATAEYERLLEKLSHQSVVKHYEAYKDIPWDDPAYAIDPADPRWELGPDEPLAATDWYQSRPPEARAAIGLHLVATFMKVGVHFESVLKRGLLEFAATLPNHAPEFRYVYHEVIEEAQHSLMFQEFVNRTPWDIPGLPNRVMAVGNRATKFGRTFPTLFFICVLGGEDPIDHVQRTMLRDRDGMHPLLHRISQIHITEEARHLAFARHYIRRHVPELGFWRLRKLRRLAPLILSRMAERMTQPSDQVVAVHGIPREVVRAAYGPNPDYRRRILAATTKSRNLCVEAGVITPKTLPRWRRFGIWPAEATLPA